VDKDPWYGSCPKKSWVYSDFHSVYSLYDTNSCICLHGSGIVVKIISNKQYMNRPSYKTKQANHIQVGCHRWRNI